MRKGPRLTLVWGPRMVNPALVIVVKSMNTALCDMQRLNNTYLLTCGPKMR